MKDLSHFLLQNLEAVHHPVPGIRNYNDRHMAFLHESTWMDKNMKKKINHSKGGKNIDFT